MESHFTRVTTMHIPRVRIVSLRFGKPVRREGRTRAQRTHYFVPDAIFGLIRWHGNEYGATLWQLSILRAVRPQQAASTIPGVMPGAEVLLRVSSVSNVRWVLSLIRQIEARGIPATDVSPDYWHCVYHRLAARIAAPDYSASQHAAYLSRLRCGF
jgi:hypothetical protein